MPTNKDLKRLVRGRMQKTGESYTTARSHLLKQKPHVAVATPPKVEPADYARLAGRTDAILKARTGCTWERWVKTLDRSKAYTWPHRDIAKHVRETYNVPGWWAQTVTVGYERIKGLRERGQRRGGLFEATKSKTFAVPLEQLYAAFKDSRMRARWLPGVELKVRSATNEKSMRISWPDETSVVVGFSRRGPAKSQVAIQHEKLPDKESAMQLKEYWAERLGVLEQLLAAER